MRGERKKEEADEFLLPLFRSEFSQLETDSCMNGQYEICQRANGSTMMSSMGRRAPATSSKAAPPNDLLRRTAAETVFDIERRRESMLLAISCRQCRLRHGVIRPLARLGGERPLVPIITAPQAGRSCQNRWAEQGSVMGHDEAL